MGNAALPSTYEQETGNLRRVRAGSAPRASRAARVSRGTALILAVLSVVLGATAGASIELYRTSHGAPVAQGSQGSGAGNAAAQPLLTAPSSAGALFSSSQHAATDSMFAPYYAAHDGASQLGTAITPALAVQGGWLQVFASGALFLPNAASSTAPAASGAKATGAPASQLARLVTAGSADPTTGVVALPLLPALLQAGSQVAIGSDSSPLTYATLRTASGTQQRVVAPAWYRPNAPTGPNGTFIPEEMRGGVVLGHMVPPAFWGALNDAQVAPNGWAADFGRPLTEALIGPLSGSTSGSGAGEQVVVQLFEHGGLVQVAQAAPATQAAGSTGATDSSVQRLAVGLDYLRTFGPPPLRNVMGTTAWATGAVAPLSQAGGTGAPEATLGESFPFVLKGGTTWVNGALWYEADWQTPHRKGTGWVPASSLSFHRPSGVATAGFDALDPALASYLAGFGGRVGAVVYDVTHGITYQYNPGGSFIVASSVKVPIMLALLTKLEAAGRAPNDNEMALLTTMIENSNNDSAQALYEEIGDAPGLTAFMAGLHLGGLQATPGAWGWSTITPQTMVDLLTRLQQGKILTGQDRTLALSLMQHIESDQQTGVGSTAPQGAITAMKDGWVPGPDGLWAVNSSGIVTVGPETYIISVYTADDGALGDGWAITEHVCGAVAQLLS